MNKFQVTDLHIFLKIKKHTLDGIYSNYLQPSVHDLHLLIQCEKEETT